MPICERFGAVELTRTLPTWKPRFRSRFSRSCRARSAGLDERTFGRMVGRRMFARGGFRVCVTGHSTTTLGRRWEAGRSDEGSVERSFAPFLDRNPCGSSSGSGVVAAADLAVAAVGTETDGSIVCPSGAHGVVGVKPTLGLWSRAGVVPISANQDTAGPIARNVTDAAVLLGAATGVDPTDAATGAQTGHALTDYPQL